MFEPAWAARGQSIPHRASVSSGSTLPDRQARPDGCSCTAPAIVIQDGPKHLLQQQDMRKGSPGASVPVLFTLLFCELFTAHVLFIFLLCPKLAAAQV